MSRLQIPDWQLPPGVSRGLWDYTHTDHIADNYDEYFARHELFEFDEQVLARHLTPPGVVADFGCGTGRALIPLARRGFSGLAIDLSEKMLSIVREKAQAESLEIECRVANLVELGDVPSAVADHGICLFSTLGMIRGRAQRRQALAHMRRILKPGGRFVIHVHNFWFNLFDPHGPWWVLGNVLRSGFGGNVERGDKFFHYRGIPNMFLHVFTRGEFVSDLKSAGFELLELVPLATNRQRALPHAWFFGGLRASGWIAVCKVEE